MACDVLIIGLGPAGGAAARAAARAGLHVIAVDKKRAIGMPVQCAEFIPPPMGQYATAASVLQQRVIGMRTILPSGAMTESAFPGLMIDRAAFDQALAHDAAAAGAALWLASVLTGLDPEHSRARISTPQGLRTVRYRLLIAGDGPHSVVAMLMRMPRLKTIQTRQYTVRLHRACADTDIWLSDSYPGGYAWLFPKAGVANLGVGMDPRIDAAMKMPLDQLHHRLVQEGRVGEKILARTGGAIPVGGVRDRLASGKVLFVGDAAGLTHPITGAGIAAAVVSGERAGQAAAAHLLGGDADALTGFEEDVRDQYEPSLARALWVRGWLESRWRTAEARRDEIHRRGWIAFPEYFAAVAEAAAPERNRFNELQEAQ
jgi:digeranylgeranylglycerophospholipid reductase